MRLIAGVVVVVVVVEVVAAGRSLVKPTGVILGTSKHASHPPLSMAWIEVGVKLPRELPLSSNSWIEMLSVELTPIPSTYAQRRPEAHSALRQRKLAAAPPPERLSTVFEHEAQSLVLPSTVIDE